MRSLHKSQNSHCAFCAVRHPLYCHHIRPVGQGGPDTPDNLVLLCGNHHELADYGLIPGELVSDYKRACASAPVAFEQDALVIYELCAANIEQELQKRHGAALMSIAVRLIRRLRRSQDRRYRVVCLRLIHGVLVASNYAPSVSGFELELVNVAREVALDMPDDEAALRLAPITHYEGLAYHQRGAFDSAKDSYRRALEIISSVTDESLVKTLSAERLMTRVHLSASMYLSGESQSSLELAERLVGEVPATPGELSDPTSFARVKLAEHFLQRSKPEAACRILMGVEAHQEVFSSLTPIYRVIMAKDIGRSLLAQGEREVGQGYLIKGAAVAREYGYLDQIAKIVGHAKDHGIDTEDVLL